MFVVLWDCMVRFVLLVIIREASVCKFVKLSLIIVFPSLTIMFSSIQYILLWHIFCHCSDSD